MENALLNNYIDFLPKSYMIEATNLTKKFNSLTVFEDLDVKVGKGEVLVVIGPSGSGKSTFLRCLNYLEEIDGGKVVIEGEELNPKDKKSIRKITTKMGMVFQNFNLFPHMTVIQNVMEAPIVVKKESKVEVLERAKKLLDKVGLADKMDYYPSKVIRRTKTKGCYSKSTCYESRYNVI